MSPSEDAIHKERGSYFSGKYCKIIFAVRSLWGEKGRKASWERATPAALGLRRNNDKSYEVRILIAM